MMVMMTIMIMISPHGPRSIPHPTDLIDLVTEMSSKRWKGLAVGLSEDIR